MSSAKPHSVPSPESVHDVWLRQRAELEHELFDGEMPAARAVVQNDVPAPFEKLADEPAAITVDADKAQHVEWLQQSNEAAARQRGEHQQRVTESLSQQREAFSHDLARQRAAFEQELSSREAAWAAQRDQEWTSLRSAKEVQEVTQRRLKEELAAQLVREREDLWQWRRQAEAELAEARRLFEQERFQQQQEFARQRETEMVRLRRERDELDARTRQVQAELALARQRQEEELRQTRDLQVAQMRAERAELDKLRDTWLEKFRREQVVLENGLQFFGQHLSRVSEELRVAQRGLQAVSESATEAHPTMPLVPITASVPIEKPLEPTILSLDEIRQRLNQLKKPLRKAA